MTQVRMNLEELEFNCVKTIGGPKLAKIPQDEKRMLQI